MQVFRIIQVIQEEQDPEDVEPPGSPFHKYQGGFRHRRHPSGHIAAHREGARLHIVIRPQLLQPEISRIHGQEQSHEDNFKGTDKEIIGGAQEGKYPVGAQKAVNDNFQYLNIDDDKPKIDDHVHDARNGPHYHFALPKGDSGHLLPACRRRLVKGHRLSHPNVSD